MQSVKRDFGTLSTEDIAYAGIAKLASAHTIADKADLLARIILEVFDDYYRRSRKIPWVAKRAFETRNWVQSVELSQERIAIYSVAIAKVTETVRHATLENDKASGFWHDVEKRYHRLLESRYEADLALAFLASIRRVIYRNTWTPVAYNTFGEMARECEFLCRFPAPGKMTAGLVEKIVAVPHLEAPFRNLADDATRVADRVNHEMEVDAAQPLESVEVVNAGFYRNRGAYVVGAIEVAGRTSPMALALLHGETGVYVDAVILRETTLRHVFSSTLANLHVTMFEYHELVGYLCALMPTRPRAMHYSTVGYNHVGKIAVMEQICSGLENGGETLDHAPGSRGSVAIGFTSPASAYVLKVIRNEPTDSYKWDEFGGAEQVLAKYRRVHELNRAGSMLDNIIYTNVSLPRTMFSETLLHDMLDEAGNAVSLYRNGVLFSHLIVQRKLVPLPLYLENCSLKDAETVVIRLGQCIRNNAATNVFNKDLDGRNYGVSSLRFVYLFDYDALETLTGVKVRTNTDREYGEEEPPDWFFEDGIIFLPEEIEAHLRLPNRDLRRLFREAHGELLTVDYWTRMQRLLNRGHVPRVRAYPRGCQLSIDGAEGNLTMSPQE